LLQTWAAVEHGYWYARSAEFLQSPLMDTLRWLRTIGDTIFAIGALTFAAAVAAMTLGRRRSAQPQALPTAKAK
jgi:nitric oxide reductase subunit B